MNYAICIGNGVNFRKGRGTNYASLGLLNKGEKMLALTNVNGWFEVAGGVNGSLITGYMSAKYVQTKT